MSKKRFITWTALVCMGALVASCSSNEEGPPGNTQLNVVVPNGAANNGLTPPEGNNGSTAPPLLDIQRVEYTITCLGEDQNPGAGFLDDGAVITDPSLRIDGNLEVVDGRTNPNSNNPPEPAYGPDSLPGDQSEVWQGWMDLAPGTCFAELRVRDNDGEVICTANQQFGVFTDTVTKVNMVVICDISFQAPVGQLDLDATFSFNVGNFCPDLFIFNSVAGSQQDQPLQETVDIGLGPFVAATTAEVRFRDPDGTCGDNCDPQTCRPDADGISCTRPASPGVSTTIFCESSPAESWILAGCAGTESTTGAGDALGGNDTCTLVGDTTGLPAEAIPGPIACTSDDDCGLVIGAPGTNVPNSCQDGVCNFTAFGQLINASIAIAIFPPITIGGPSGVVLNCTATTTDGDVDCNKTKSITIYGPGESPCQQLCGVGNEANCDNCGIPVCKGGDNPGGDCGTNGDADCPNGTCGLNECVGNICDDSTGVAVCSNPNIPAPSGNEPACDDFTPVPGICDGAGTCEQAGCTTNADCPGATECANQTLCCNAGNVGGFGCATETNICAGAAEPINPGDLCDASSDGTAPDSGACVGTTCVANDQCDLDPANECPAQRCVGGDFDGKACTTDGECAPGGGACFVTSSRACDVDSTNAGAACSSDTDCDGGNCITPDSECVDAACDTSGIPNLCSWDITSQNGVLCNSDTGACQNGLCGTLPVDYPPSTLDISMACTNQAQPQMSEIPGTLTVDPTDMLGGAPFDAALTGNLNFPENFLDVATTLLPPGTTEAQIVDLVATVRVRSGTTGNDDVAIGVDPTLPTACAISATACDPATNNPNGTNSACLPSALDTCGSFLALPLGGVQSVCANLTGALGTTCVGGVNDKQACDPGSDGGASECPGATAGIPAGCVVGASSAPLNGEPCTTDGYSVQPCENGTKLIEWANFGGCITGDLALPLGDATGNYTAGASGSTALFGWIDDVGTSGAQFKQCPDSNNSECYSTNPSCDLGELTSPVCAVDGPYTDGTNNYWSLPTPSFSAPIGPLATKVNAGLQVAINCVMGAVITPPDCEFVAPFCNGGADDGLSCDPDVECPGGTCTDNACVGGANDLLACDPNVDCASPGNCQTSPPCGCNSADANATNPDGCATMLGVTPDSDLIQFLVP